MGRLTTHVLDTAHGRPGEGIALALYRCTPTGRLLLGHHVTNADGRCDAPLLVGSAFTIGTYELEFWIGDYYERLGLELMQPRFLDVVTLRFGIGDEAGHYHVPLLVSPYGYTTYRGS